MRGYCPLIGKSDVLGASHKLLDYRMLGRDVNGERE